MTPLTVKNEPALPSKAGTKVSGTAAEMVMEIKQNKAFDSMVPDMRIIIAIEGDTKHHHMKIIAWNDVVMLFSAAFALSNPRDRYCMKLQTTIVVFHVVANMVSERMIGGVYELTSIPPMDRYLMNPMLMETETNIVSKPRMTNIDAFVTSTSTSIETGIENTIVHFMTYKRGFKMNFESD